VSFHRHLPSTLPVIIIIIVIGTSS
jgi:hypothetical protein